MAKKKNNLVKDTMAVGIGSMAGLGAMGAMSNIPGMPKESGNIVGAAGAGFTMLNIGQMTKNAMSITGSMKTGKKKKSTGNKYLDRMM